MPSLFDNSIGINRAEMKRLESVAVDMTDHVCAELRAIEEMRSKGELAYDSTPLRLYQVKDGRFIRVLDAHAEGISGETLEAIDNYLHNESARHSSPAIAVEEPPVNDDNGTTTDVEAVDLATRHSLELDAQPDMAEDELMAECQETTIIMDPATDALTQSHSVSSDEIVETPQELHRRNEPVHVWLGGTIENQSCEDESDLKKPTTDDTIDNDHETLNDCSAEWPAHLEVRRKIRFLARPPEASRSSGKNSADRPVVYWLQNCFRISRSNFALEAALMLAQRQSSPLIVLCIAPASVTHPVSQAESADDAYLRWSLIEIQEHCCRSGVEFVAVTLDEMKDLPRVPQSLETMRNPLLTLIDSFGPRCVVTDTLFDSAGRRCMLGLTQHLQLNKASGSWSLFEVDSLSYVPAYNMSPAVRDTLVQNANFASESEFRRAYAECAARCGEQHNTRMSEARLQELPSRSMKTRQRIEALDHLGLEEVDWSIAKGIAAQSSGGLATFTESAGIKKVDALLAAFSDSPAIQAELQGGGVLSLLPFVRHGSLFSGDIIQRVSEAIDFFPAPTTPQDRKALASLKVMRSRALAHLAEDRDYALYLALWASIQEDGGGNDQVGCLGDQGVQSPSPLNCFVSGLSCISLDASCRLLPPWVSNNVRLDAHGDNSAPGLKEGGALYDPYELESGRTKDEYWNAIQRSVIQNHYLHPLLAVYWAHRILEWSVSTRSGIAMIDALLAKCSSGSKHSPDAVFTVWNLLFRVGQPEENRSDLSDPRAFQRVLEVELSSQPKLKFE